MRCYAWLEKNLPTVFERAGIDPTFATGSISADGDKTGQYSNKWKEEAIPFEHGTALYMVMNWLYRKEVRETSNGWIAPVDWVISNYNRFKHLFNDL